MFTWHERARAFGWNEERIKTFSDAVTRQHGQFEHVDANCMVLRTSRGARQVMYRELSIRCIHDVNVATEHLPEWIKPCL